MGRTAGRPPKPLTPGTDARSRLRVQMRQLRKAHGLTLQDVAEAVGCSDGHLSNVEHGRAVPSAGLVAACDAVYQANGLLVGLWEDVWAERKQRLSDREPPYGEGRPAAADRPPVSEATLPGDASCFVGDLSIPDGMPMRPGQRFTKSWRVLNCGSREWRDRWLQRQGPVALASGISTPARVRVPDAEPGDEVQIDVGCVAPVMACSPMAVFKMVFADGRLCFPDRYLYGLNISVTVPAHWT